MREAIPKFTESDIVQFPMSQIQPVTNETSFLLPLVFIYAICLVVFMICFFADHLLPLIDTLSAAFSVVTCGECIGWREETDEKGEMLLPAGIAGIIPNEACISV
jgi:hypothetical protein